MSAHTRWEMQAAKPIMDVAILYEDWGTGVRAKRTCDQLAREVTPEVDLALGLWRFDLLEEELLRAEALQAATGADLLFVSAHGYQALPGALDSWLHQWLQQRVDAPTGLVVSLDSIAKGSPAAERILTNLAPMVHSAKADLFFHFGPAPQRENTPLITASPTPRPMRGRPADPHRPEQH